MGASFRSLLVAAAGAAFVGVSAQAFAERADKDKPTVIEASKSSIDDLNQTSIYSGNVVLTKGTIVLRTDQLTVRQDPEGYTFGTAVNGAGGTLAYFKQKREGVDEFIEGQAERIEYDEKADMVRLFNRAVVKILRAGREADEARGDRIDYNSRTDVYNVDSSGGQDAGKRARFVIQPKIKPGAPGDVPAGRPIELKKAPVVEARP